MSLIRGASVLQLRLQEVRIYACERDLSVRYQSDEE